MNYFISSSLEIRNTTRGLGVFTKIHHCADVIVEHSPFSSCWASKWQDTPENLRKIVFVIHLRSFQIIFCNLYYLNVPCLYKQHHEFHQRFQSNLNT